MSNDDMLGIKIVVDGGAQGAAEITKTTTATKELGTAADSTERKLRVLATSAKAGEAPFDAVAAAADRAASRSKAAANTISTSVQQVIAAQAQFQAPLGGGGAPAGGADFAIPNIGNIAGGIAVAVGAVAKYTLAVHEAENALRLMDRAGEQAAQRLAIAISTDPVAALQTASTSVLNLRNQLDDLANKSWLGKLSNAVGEFVGIPGDSEVKQRAGKQILNNVDAQNTAMRAMTREQEAQNRILKADLAGQKDKAAALAEQNKYKAEAAALEAKLKQSDAGPYEKMDARNALKESQSARTALREKAQQAEQTDFRGKAGEKEAAQQRAFSTQVRKEGEDADAAEQAAQKRRIKEEEDKKQREEDQAFKTKVAESKREASDRGAAVKRAQQEVTREKKEKEQRDYEQKRTEFEREKQRLTESPADAAARRDAEKIDRSQDRAVKKRQAMRKIDRGDYNKRESALDKFNDREGSALDKFSADTAEKQKQKPGTTGSSSAGSGGDAGSGVQQAMQPAVAGAQAVATAAQAVASTIAANLNPAAASLQNAANAMDRVASAVSALDSAVSNLTSRIENLEGAN